MPLKNRYVAQIVKSAPWTPGATHHRSSRFVTPRPLEAVPGALCGIRRLAGSSVIDSAPASRRSMIASAKAAVPAVPPRS